MSQTISQAAVVSALKRAAQVLRAESSRLNDLDQIIGDGDIGITLDKIGAALVDYADSASVDGDLGKWLGRAGMAANKAGSSSFGTLLASALMRAGKAIPGKTELTEGDLVIIFRAAFEGVQERGKANLGDKTVLDALYPASQAFAAMLDAGQNLSAAAQAALQAAEVGRDSVTPQRSKVGRASWVGERTEGQIDPGCEAFVVILAALIG